jgi:hypothetical protein
MFEVLAIRGSLSVLKLLSERSSKLDEGGLVGGGVVSARAFVDFILVIRFTGEGDLFPEDRDLRMLCGRDIIFDAAGRKLECP